MATAAVLPVPNQLATSFNQGEKLIVKTAVTIPSNVPGGANQTVLADQFILSDQCFIDLQMYLKAAMRFPDSDKTFEATYPTSWFKPYFTSDDKLYEDMKRTMVGINNHCADFWAKTMGPMVTLAGRISNFSDEAKTSGEYLLKQMAIITKDGAKLTDEDVKQAIKRASDTLGDLKDECTDVAKSCAEYVTKLSDFSVITEKDKIAISDVATRTTKYLPSNAKLTADLREKMDEATRKMQAALDRARKAEAAEKSSRSVKWYYFIAWPLTLGMALSNSKDANEARRLMQEADTEYKSVLTAAGQEMAGLIGLKEKCDNLQSTIKGVQEAISKALLAVEHIKNAFSTMQTDVEAIKGKLGRADEKIIDEDIERRTRAYKELEGANTKWELVKNLARNFQAKGLLIEASLQEKVAEPTKEDNFEVMGATFGPSNCTGAAKVLFNDGADMLVDSTQMISSMPDPWSGIKKTITMLYNYGKQQRLFICTERSGEHRMIRGPIETSMNSRSTQVVVTPRAKPSGAIYQVLAIVYGGSEVRSDRAYDYVYQQMGARRSVRFTNDTFGDTWVGTPKSGVVYYTTDGRDVKLLTAKEGEEAPW